MASSTKSSKTVGAKTRTSKKPATKNKVSKQSVQKKSAQLATPLEQSDQELTLGKPKKSEQVAKEPITEQAAEQPTKQPPEPRTPEPFNLDLPVAAEPKPKQPFWRRRLYKAMAAGVVVAVIVLVSLLKFTHKPPKQTASAVPAVKSHVTLSTSTTAPQQAKLLLLEGQAEVSNDNTSWSNLAANATLNQGQYIRAGANGRLAIGLADGSIVRLNKGALIRLTTLNSSTIVIDQLHGEVYSRVAESPRKFRVVVDAAEYLAHAAAYKTIAADKTNGVAVYQSSVAIGNTTLNEGQQSYLANPNAALVNKPTPITKEQLLADAFMRWNYEQDKALSQFKDKLGLLKNFDAQTSASAPTPIAVAPAVATSPTGNINLAAGASSDGVILAWSVAGNPAGSDFQLIKTDGPMPVYGSGESIHVTDPTQRDYTWQVPDGNTYYFRACIFAKGSCTAYSNEVVITVPKATPSDPQPSGNLVLTHERGKQVSWTLNGSAPYGYQLVWSTDPSPAYGRSASQAYAADATSGNINFDGSNDTYYVRICMYTGSGCVNYSNEIEISRGPDFFNEP